MPIAKLFAAGALLVTLCAAQALADTRAKSASQTPKVTENIAGHSSGGCRHSRNYHARCRIHLRSESSHRHDFRNTPKRDHNVGGR
jgi:hypothetical protein